MKLELFSKTLAGLLVGSLALGYGIAGATILTFDNLGIADFSPISGAYGDRVNATSDAVGSYGMGNGFTPQITVEYRTLDSVTGATLSNSLNFWTAGYGNLQKVAF